MDFSLNSEQSQLRESVQRFVERDYGFEARKKIVALPGGFSRDHWRTFAELGWLGAALPEDVGGLGGTSIDTMIVMEEFGRGLVAEPYLSTAVLGAQLVNVAGNAKQRQDLLPALIAGELLLAVAYSEPQSAGAADWVEAKAERTRTGWRLGFGKTDVHKQLLV